MSLKFNPFTGTLDFVGDGGGGVGFITQQPDTARFIGPLQSGAAVAGVANTNSLYTYFEPFFTPRVRAIEDLVFEVVTASVEVGATIEVAAYLPRSASDSNPGLQIANSEASVTATTTGVKSVTFSPTWDTPAGLFYLGIKVVAVASSVPTLKCFEGAGRAPSFIGNLIWGFPTSPLTDYSLPSAPYVLQTDSAGILTDYTASAIGHFDPYGDPMRAIFIK